MNAGRASLERHKEDWERLAEVDAMWAVLTAPSQRGGRWDVEAFFASGEAEIEHVLSVVQSLGRPLSRGRALDFGCGVGRLTRALGSRFERAIGVDISEGMVAQAVRLNERFTSCEFRVNAAAHLGQFATDSFDFVYSSIVLQHLPSRRDVSAYVSEFLRVARPDGLAVFGIPGRIAFPWSLQLRRRLYGTLRRLGVSEEWMLRRTPLTPMRMTVVPELAVRQLLEEQGAELLHVEKSDDGPVRTLTYFVVPPRG
jgi:SAM-dependent methyltransferase